MPQIKQVDQATFQKLLSSDPEIQAVIRRVWGNTPVDQRPSQTPGNLKQANHDASQQIAQILKAKGVQLPPHTFINPRSSALEGEHGWAGVPLGMKIAIIASVAAGGVGAAGALGAFGGAAAAGGGAGAAGGGAAGAAIPSLAVASGVPAGIGTALPALAIPGAVAGGAAAGGGAVAGGAGAASGGGVLSKIGQSMSSKGLLGRIAGVGGPIASGLATGMQSGRENANTNASNIAKFNLEERQGNETNLENRAGLDLRQRQFAQDSRNNAYAGAMKSAFAKNIQDVHATGVPKGIPVIHFEGGLRPSAMGPEGRAAAGEMNRQSMLSLMNGEKFDALPALERTAAPDLKNGGTMENILGGLGVGMNAINDNNIQNQNQSDTQSLLAKIQAIVNAKRAAPPSSFAPAITPPSSFLDDQGDTSNR